MKENRHQIMKVTEGVGSYGFIIVYNVLPQSFYKTQVNNRK
jgi:hypothetical protein